MGKEREPSLKERARKWLYKFMEKVIEEISQEAPLKSQKMDSDKLEELVRLIEGDDL